MATRRLRYFGASFGQAMGRCARRHHAHSSDCQPGAWTGRAGLNCIQGANVFRVSRPLFSGYFRRVSTRRGNIRAVFHATSADGAARGAARHRLCILLLLLALSVRLLVGALLFAGLLLADQGRRRAP